MKPTKCAFVTGGSRGIGSGVVKVLAREGYDIAFTYHSAEEEAKEMSEYVKGLGRRCFYYQASLEERDVPTRVTRQAIQDLGRLDVLVNNAGLPVITWSPKWMLILLTLCMEWIFVIIFSVQEKQHGI